MTGAAGFVGRHLVGSLCAGGADVGALDLAGALSRAEQEGAIPPAASTIPCDLTRDDSSAAIASFRPEIVFHLAGHASVPASLADPGSDFRANVVGTFGLLEAVRLVPEPPVLVNVSSAAVYGSGCAEPLSEDRIPVPASPYGAAKLSAETYLRAYCEAFGSRGASVRLFSLFGPGLRRHVVFDLMAKLAGDPRSLEVMGDGGQVRELLYIDDCVAALLTVGERGRLRGEVYNAGGGIVVTVRALVDAVTRAMSLAPDVSFTGKNRQAERDRWVADTTRLRGLGFEPRIDLEAGLRATVAWFRKEVAPSLDP